MMKCIYAKASRAVSLLLSIAVFLGVLVAGAGTEAQTARAADGPALRVTTGADDGPGSLRQAFADVADGGEIVIDSAVKTITLTSRIAPGGKNVTVSVTNKAQPVTIDARGITDPANFHAIDMTGNGSLTLSNLIFRGKGIWVRQAALRDCRFEGTTSTAVLASSNVQAINCSFTGNGSPTANGGAISTVTLTAANCTFADNRSNPSSGAIRAQVVYIFHCTLIDTQGGYGIYTSGTYDSFRIYNSILAGNTGGNGDTQVFSNSTAVIEGCTIQADSAGIFGDNALPAGVLGYYMPLTSAPDIKNATVLSDIPITDQNIKEAMLNALKTDAAGNSRPASGACTCGAVEATGSTLMVRNRNDSGPGSLRAALAAAEADAAGSQKVIMFAENVSGTIELDSTITLGAYTSPASRPNLRISIVGRLDGEGAPDITIESDESDVRVLENSSSGKLTLYGLEIIRGGITSYASIDLEDCVFSDCTSNYGGAVRTDWYATATRCTFEGNTAEWNAGGGAVHGSHRVTLSGCTFKNNTAAGAGGAVSTMDSSDRSVTATDCIFEGNTIFFSRDSNPWGGGAIYGGTVTVTDCDFVQNEAGPGDGATTYKGGAISGMGDVTANNCTFEYNDAYWQGGAIFTGTNATVKDCIFKFNTAQAKGGAIYGGKNVNVDGCTFSSNSAKTDSGGAIFAENPDGTNTGVTAKNSTFTSNRAVIHGGGIYTRVYLRIDNCEFRLNSATRHGGGVDGNDIIATDSIFYRNSIWGTSDSAEDCDGSAMYTNTFIVAANCSFTGNNFDRYAEIPGAEARYGAVTAGDTLALIHCTVADNNLLGSATGTHYGVYQKDAGKAVYLYNSIVAGNAGAQVSKTPTGGDRLVEGELKDGAAITFQDIFGENAVDADGLIKIAPVPGLAAVTATALTEGSLDGLSMAEKAVVMAAIGKDLVGVMRGLTSTGMVCHGALEMMQTPAPTPPATLRVTYAEGLKLSGVMLPGPGYTWADPETPVGGASTTPKMFPAYYNADPNEYSAMEIDLYVLVDKAPAPPVITPTGTFTGEEGQALSTVTGLPVGWAWVDGTVLMQAADTQFQAKFTPPDTANYDYTGIDGWDGVARVVKRYITVTVNALPTDETPPTGSITVGEDSWDEFHTDVAFGYFYPALQDIVITAEDEQDGSGLESLQYYKSGDAMSADDLDGLEASKWSAVDMGTLTIPNTADGAYILYLKMTDASGNTAYINSGGLVFDSTAPIIKLDGTLAGADTNTYASGVDVTVTDTWLDSVTGVDPTPTVSGGEAAFTLGANGTYTITATDKSGNTSSKTLIVNLNYDSEQAIASAIALIQSGSYSYTQEQAPDAVALAPLLEATIQAALAQLPSVSVGAINVTVFTPATAGTLEANDGVNGSFTFTVALSASDGSGSASGEAGASGVITSTRYTPQPSVGISANPADATVTIGGDVLLTATPFDILNVSYQWYSSASETGPGTAIAGATASAYAPPTAAAGATWYYCQVNEYSSPAVCVTVNKFPAAPVDTPANRTATYGQTLGEIEQLPTGWVWEEDSGTPVGDAGNQGHAALFAPSDTETYDYSGLVGWDSTNNAIRRIVIVEVAKAPQPALSISGLQTVIYGEGITLLTIGGEPGCQISWSSDDTAVAAVDPQTGVVTATGVGAATITATAAEMTNHLAASATTTLTVTARPVTLEADDQQKTFGDPDPAFTWSLTEGSIVGSDTFTGSLMYEGSKIGTYPIVEDEPLHNPNYGVTFVPGIMTITPTEGMQKVIDLISALPEPAGTYEQADLVAAATNAFAALPEAEQNGLPDEILARLQKSQEQAGIVNHNGESFAATAGLPWHVRVVVTPVRPPDLRWLGMRSSIGKELLALFEITLVDTLTGGPYVLPAGETVTLKLLGINLAGRANAVAVHQKADGSIEYIYCHVEAGSVMFSTGEFSLYGVAADFYPETGGAGGGRSASTGDDIDLWLPLLAMLLAAGCIAVCLVVRRKKTRGSR